MTFSFTSKNALTQVIIISITFFACPGMFNALSSFASGIDDPSIAFNGNCLIYLTFSLTSFIASGFLNLLGSRLSLFLGSLGYVLYAVALLVIQRGALKIDGKTHHQPFTITMFYIVCPILGICAGLLWTAQGQLCMAYPSKNTKGKYFSIFWIIFNMGSTIGGIITFITNFGGGDDSSTISDNTFIVFIVIMLIGSMSTLLLAKPDTVIRDDGELVCVQKLPHWKSETFKVFKLFRDKKMLLLVPLFAYSNWFYTYHSFYNVTIFNKRTSGLVTTFYWGSQMIAAFLLGKYLDRKTLSQREKATASLNALTFLTLPMWWAGYWIQKTYRMEYRTCMNVDFSDSLFIPTSLLYAFYGFNDSLCQVWSYWLMGQMSDDIHMLGRYAAFYKAIQSCMAAVSWRLGGNEVNPMIQVIINCVLASVGFMSAYFSISMFLPKRRESA